ncbi:glycosyltransferase [Pseudochryseolinea flava]|uniref:glycosyltransferase n=1 Tax=Pseudochryseolinea flava TaxID=2059302 RepID=UPI00140263C1|nr:glycosyltransferase family 2 protein [Pseudochryseolinea flava]
MESLLLLYFFYVVAYTFVFSVAGLFYREPRSTKSDNFFKFVVFIPSYKDDSVIVSVAEKSLQQHYPQEHYKVVVIADSLQPETLQKLRQLPIEVEEVKFDVSTKVKSLIEALKRREGYDYAVILDADNVMYADFLTKINEAHQLGYEAVQGQRLAKNTGNELSFLDGLSEAINNHVYRQGTVALGLSCSISGSAISVNYHTFKDILLGMTSVGGFDREMELLLLQRGLKVAYLKSAGVLDEKVQKDQVFENQRKRWISSQYHYLAKYFGKGMKAFFEGNFTFFNSAVLRNIQLPRLVNIGLLGILTIALFFVRAYLYFGYEIWLTFSALMFLSIAISIPREYYTLDLLKAFLKVPGIFFRMFLLLFRLKGANKKFIHTPHYNIEVNIDKPNK